MVLEAAFFVCGHLSLWKEVKVKMNFCNVFSFVTMAVLVTAHGVFMSCYICSLTLSALELFGLIRFNFANGMFYFFYGIGVFTVPPVVSYIFEILNQDIFSAMIVLGAIYGLSFFLSLTCFVSHRYGFMCTRK